ncbi:MAG: hypothetical protein KDC44_13490, partial [Phaeodactylibacter sp.]|nr:hypothetical protein [Phaeodactylibacter sp.]
MAQSDGDLWLGTSDGVFHRQGQTWLHYDETQLGPLFFEAWDIEINSAGEVLVGSNAVFKFADGAWTSITDASDLLVGYLHAALFHSSSGELYFAGDLEALGRFDGTSWERYEFSDPAAFDVAPTGHQIIGFAEDEDGAVYLNTQNEGVFKLENGLWTQQTDAFSTQFDNHSDFFYIDADNQRWLNESIYFSVDRNGSIETARIAEHTLESNQVYQIRKGQEGALYFMVSSSQSLAVRMPDGNWTTLPLPADLTLWGIIGDVLALAENDIWIAAYDGLYQYDGSAWLHHEVGPCAGLAVDVQGIIYVRAQNRIHKIENGAFTEYNSSNSALTTGILSGHGVDAAGNLWVAAFDEAVIQRMSPEGNWTTYTAT